MFTDSQKKDIYNKWAQSGYKQTATKEELDIIVELQSKGYKTNTFDFKDYTGNYRVTELQEPKLKQEKSTAELIEEAKKYLEIPKQQEQTKREKELEQSIKKWDQYFEKNRGKIPNEWPKSIFDVDTY
jgi:hypothetical protein